VRCVKRFTIVDDLLVSGLAFAFAFGFGSELRVFVAVYDLSRGFPWLVCTSGRGGLALVNWIVGWLCDGE